MTVGYSLPLVWGDSVMLMGDGIQLRKAKECFVPASVGFLWVRLGLWGRGLGLALIFPHLLQNCLSVSLERDGETRLRIQVWQI